MRVCAVEFGRLGRLHYVTPPEGDVRLGDRIVVESEHGLLVGRCVWGPQDLELDADLPRALRLATPRDEDVDAAAGRRRDSIAETARELIARHRLPMTVIATDLTDEGPNALVNVYFRSPHRVDFRGLVSDLSQALGTRVDLRQLGARDLAALLGDVGPCGRELCCCALCPASEPVPARLTRGQESAQGALGLAGSCGRLKCCLAYEADAYASFAERAPRVGAIVATEVGEGVVSGHAMPADSVWVRTEDGQRLFALDAVTLVRPAIDLDADEPVAEASVDVNPGRRTKLGRRRPVPGPPKAKRTFLRREKPPASDA